MVAWVLLLQWSLLLHSLIKGQQAVGCRSAHSMCVSPPQPVRFVLLSKQGNHLLPQGNIALVVSYLDQKQRVEIPHVIWTFSTSDLAAHKYGGVGIGCDLGGYSVRAINPIKEFDLTVNGRPVGVLTYDLQRTDQAHGCYKEVAFLFNGTPVVIDTGVRPFVAVIRTQL
jgi:hypothetical protein